ncbi:MAG TPA: hypothetical protein VNT50_06590 [Microbacterium sp.]|uniref:hypothetical protein n=1 Tax=Microbacterium sp. TaxID=51671 RepID=UPI002C0D66BF|nr:hypothetical protein [Microbacterium sp.]HWI31138.1 hypothetical protein [Microbacterium sp.]
MGAIAVHRGDATGVDVEKTRIPAIAWVESPLQLIGAAEWASAHRRRIPIAGRLTPQMSETADELVARGAMFSACEPYLGIPWKLLSQHRHWLVGDGFSGQFRLAAALLRPRRITFLDDGANTLAYADALTGRRAYARPGVSERGMTTRVVPFAHDQILGRALAGDVEFFTAFELGQQRNRELADLGIRILPHRFEWTRRTARPFAAPGGRIILGSARPVDNRMPLPEYLRWVEAQASVAPALYLPHRREPAEHTLLVAAIDGITVSEAHLPVELLVAGATEPLDVITLASSTTTTLPLVLEGTGSVIRRPDADAARHDRSLG